MGKPHYTSLIDLPTIGVVYLRYLLQSRSLGEPE
jgi:hypothetical protein